MSISSVFVIFSPKMITKSIVSRNPNFKSQFLSSISLRPLTRSGISIQKRHKRCSSTVTATSTSPSLLEQLPPKLQEIIRAFQTVQEPKMKYEQLLFYGRKLNPLGSQFKINENKVRGCVSQVWVRAFLDTEKNIFYEADSDSVLTKGLAALLVEGLSGRPASEIVHISPDFVQLLGIQQSLTPSRNNGFLNMLKLMQRKALELLVEPEGMDDSVKNSTEADEGKPDDFSNVTVSSNGELEIENESKAPNSSNVLEMNSNETLGSRGQRMKEKLEKELQPTHFEIEDISYQHAGHAGVRGSDRETHFNLTVVSKEFEGKSMVKRHRLIYDLVQEELQSGLHALSIVAKTPSEV